MHKYVLINVGNAIRLNFNSTCNRAKSLPSAAVSACAIRKPPTVMNVARSDRLLIACSRSSEKAERR